MKNCIIKYKLPGGRERERERERDGTGQEEEDGQKNRERNRERHNSQQTYTKQFLKIANKDRAFIYQDFKIITITVWHHCQRHHC